MSTACDACLRQSALVGRLALRIADALGRPRRTPNGLLALSEEDLVEAVAGRDAEAVRRFLAGFRPQDARGRVADESLWCVCRHDALYPDRLLELGDPPSVLYLTSEPERLVSLLADPVVTLVGARRASPYGLEVARALGRGLAAAGITVTSGLALGIDAAAHEGALAVSGAHPIAVLACGAEQPYPRRHRRLHERIREAGTVISELPPGTRPFRWSFPARNRIMAALAQVTVVVEAAECSGSLITAQFAEDLGRDVAAVPGRVTTSVAAGSNRLLRDGAGVIRCTEDLLDDVYGVGGWGVGDRPALPAPDLEPDLQRVLEGVEAGEGVTTISRSTGLAAQDVRAALGRLELGGFVRRGSLGGYERVAGP